MKDLHLIIGKSGTGKNYFCEAFGLKSVPSYTTRPMRENEVNGKEHIFVDINTWSKMKKNGLVAASTMFHNNYYWTTIEQLNDPKYDAYIIDPRGYYDMLQLVKQKKLKRNLHVVVFKAGMRKRFKFMRKRKDSLRNIISRMWNDKKEFNTFHKTIQKQASNLHFIYL
jgi:guanylate kinase